MSLTKFLQMSLNGQLCQEQFSKTMNLSILTACIMASQGTKYYGNGLLISNSAEMTSETSTSARQNDLISLQPISLSSDTSTIILDSSRKSSGYGSDAQRYSQDQVRNTHSRSTSSPWISDEEDIIITEPHNFDDDITMGSDMVKNRSRSDMEGDQTGSAMSMANSDTERQHLVECESFSQTTQLIDFSDPSEHVYE